eukprot:TRINITY_DN1332_c0_g1_i1.p1 TRINITY_DN1332_c0_g1~~TRINITY_DN1332_c0_g1_i1.p1  ORF type:complete len:166 (+),score=35.38 TRINITY_DN1332_c0_g1_i1:303-800(+)
MDCIPNGYDELTITNRSVWIRKLRGWTWCTEALRCTEDNYAQAKYNDITYINLTQKRLSFDRYLYSLLIFAICFLLIWIILLIFQLGDGNIKAITVVSDILISFSVSTLIAILYFCYKLFRVKKEIRIGVKGDQDDIFFIKQKPHKAARIVSLIRNQQQELGIIA